MTSDDCWATFSKVVVRLPHWRQRNLRYPWAVRSGHPVIAAAPHLLHCIPVCPADVRRLCRGSSSPAICAGANRFPMREVLRKRGRAARCCRNERPVSKALLNRSEIDQGLVPAGTNQAPAVASIASMSTRSVGSMTGANSGEWLDGSSFRRPVFSACAHACRSVPPTTRTLKARFTRGRVRRSLRSRTTVPFPAPARRRDGP